MSVASNFEGSLRLSKNPWDIRPSALRRVLRTIKSMDLTATGVEVSVDGKFKVIIDPEERTDLAD